MKELNEEQKRAFDNLFQNIKKLEGRCHFELKEIPESPFYEIRYLEERLCWVEFKRFENGNAEFVLKFHKVFLDEGEVSQECANVQFFDEVALAGMVQKSLNEMYKIKNGDILGYVHVDEGNGDSDETDKEEIRKLLIDSPIHFGEGDLETLTEYLCENGFIRI